jgi:glycosyltransferase involved in cell wall biosynthesis
MPSIAYIAQKFPSLTATFTYREVFALREKGFRVRTFSIWKPQLTELSEEARELVDSTCYVFPLAWLKFLRTHLYFLVTVPTRYVSILLSLLMNAGSPKGGLRSLYHFAEAVYLAREMKARNIKHIHSTFAANTATIAMVISKLTGVTFSFTAHAYDIFLDDLHLKKKIEEASFVVTCSEYNKEYLSGLCPDVPKEKIHVVHYGVDLEDFRPSPTPKEEGEDERPLILSVARLEEKKGLVYLVEACHLLKKMGHKFRCVIAGAGSQEELLQTTVEKRQLGEDVQLAGRVFQERVKQLYNEAAIFALPCVIASNNDRDGMPNVLIEAMAMKIPTVSTSLIGIPELIQHNITGLLVPPRNSEALAQAIASLLKDEKLRKRLGENGRRKVEREFDVRKSAEQLIGLFETEFKDGT